MGREILINHLREEGRKRAAKIWRDAERNLEEYRKRRQLEAEGSERACRREHEERVRLIRREILAQGKREAVARMIQAEARLGRRLFEIAKNLLQQLRDDDYPRAFARLLAELPPCRWEKILVNPSDITLAQGVCPDGVEVVADGSLAGGLVMISEADGVTVDNSLETRLARAWPVLLPQVMARVKEDLLEAASAYE